MLQTVQNITHNLKTSLYTGKTCNYSDLLPLKRMDEASWYNEVRLYFGLNDCYTDLDKELLNYRIELLTKSCVNSSTSLFVDKSTFESWVRSNPRCVPFEAWERYNYIIFDDLKLDFKVEELKCKLAFDIAVEKINCDLILAIKANKTDCGIELQASAVAKTCNLELDYVAELQSCGASLNLIAKTYESGCELDISGNSVLLKTGEAEYNIQDFEFN